MAELKPARQGSEGQAPKRSIEAVYLDDCTPLDLRPKIMGEPCKPLNLDDLKAARQVKTIEVDT